MTQPIDHIYPDEGGQFVARLYAFYRSCVDSVVFNLNIPSINSSTVDCDGKDVLVIPTLLNSGQIISCKSTGIVRWVNILGMVLAQQQYTPETGIKVPVLNNGYYMVLVTENDKQVLKKVLIE